MRTEMPILMCEAGEWCGVWDTDHYAMDVSAVGGVRITATVRAPGWFSTEDEDYCPDHIPPATNARIAPPHLQKEKTNDRS